MLRALALTLVLTTVVAQQRTACNCDTVFGYRRPDPAQSCYSTAQLAASSLVTALCDRPRVDPGVVPV